LRRGPFNGVAQGASGSLGNIVIGSGGANPGGDLQLIRGVGRPLASLRSPRYINWVVLSLRMPMATQLDILVTGGTGFIGQHLIPLLIGRGHRVRVLAREGSLKRVPKGATPVVGDALNADTVGAALRAGDTMVHLVGTAHPSPSKAGEFDRVDLMSIRCSVEAAKRAAIAHLVYVSVAQPAPVMAHYLWVRSLGEAMIREAALTASILRPWYVLGPGRGWPKLMAPFYRLAEWFPPTRASAERLGLVTIEQFVIAMVQEVENPPARGQRRIIDVPAIRRARLAAGNGFRS